MFRQIIEYKGQFYVRKWIGIWWYWHRYSNDWRGDVRTVEGMGNVADLETRWKLRGCQFVQWL